jgi:hypothetical protein
VTAENVKRNAALLVQKLLYLFLQTLPRGEISKKDETSCSMIAKFWLNQRNLSDFQLEKKAAINLAFLARLRPIPRDGNCH